ncbi:MAG: DegT/DnrJ/EryC1/StrS family aminotransferase [Chloroflexota bacterium]
MEAHREEIDAAIRRVLDSGWFVLGPEGKAFEHDFAAYHGAGFETIGVASGTDALRIGLQAMGVAPGDEVLVVANAGVPPVAAVVAMHATPVYCDVTLDGYTLDPLEIERRSTDLTRAILVVHLYGRMAAMDQVVASAGTRGLGVIEDCAQAHGARLQGQLAGAWGDAAAFSFYPTKNLGALGDGGAVLTRDSRIAEQARLLRNYGWQEQYLSELHSTNSRLDELQAAVLAAKLPYLDASNAARRRLAAVYRESLSDLESLILPRENGPDEPVYHLFVVRVMRQRDELRAFLAEHGIGSGVHYPLPAHLQPAYAHFGEGPGSLPHTERLSKEVLSLPLYPELSPDDVTYVAQLVKAFFCRGT